MDRNRQPTWHTLRPEESQRIKCQTDGCDAQATEGCHVPWSAAGTHSVSFFYHCPAHAEARKERMRIREAERAASEAGWAKREAERDLDGACEKLDQFAALGVTPEMQALVDKAKGLLQQLKAL